MQKFKFWPFFLLAVIVSAVYYKFLILGKIPFPADLLIVSYSPWFDYYKFPVQNPLISDVFSQFFLWKHLAVDTIKNLQMPLWNPYSFTGTPLLATYHSAVLYPLNLLLFLPQYFGWGFYIYSQTLLSTFTFYLFASTFTKSRLASIAGALIFSFGGLMTTWLELGTAVHAMVWLPLAMFAVYKFASSGKFRFIIILIFSLTLTILAGNAQITTYSFIIVSLYCLWQFFQKQIKGFERIALFAALIFTLALTAVQLLPSFDFLQKSIRLTDSYISENNYGLLPLKDSFKFFIPDYFGNTVTRNYWGNLNYSETSGYLGVLSLPLLIYFFMRVRLSKGYFFAGLFLLSLLAVFDNPASRFVYNLKIPLLTSSYASRALFITLFSSAAMSALAIGRIIEKKDFFFLKRTVIWSWSVIVGMITGTLLSYLYVSEIIKNAPGKDYLKIYLESKDYALNNFIIAFKNSLLPLALLSALIILIFVWNKVFSKVLVRGKLKIFLMLFLILLIFDLGRYFLKFNPFTQKHEIFPKTPSLAFLQNQKGVFRVGREFAEVLPPNTWTAYGLYSIEGYDPLYLSSYANFMHFLNGGDLRSGTTGRYAEVSATYQSPFIDALNVRYYIVILRDKNGQVPGDLLNYKFKETDYNIAFKDRSSAILENPSASQRAYFAKKIITATDQEIKNLFMTEKSFNPKNTAALSQDLGISEVTGEGQINITEYSPNKVKINTETASDEILILADQYDEGWQAKIDGTKTKIAKANLILRAVKVPKGKHEIIFEYKPESFYNGLKISLAAFALITVLGLYFLKIRRF